MKKRKLKKLLSRTTKVRDEWCDEYTKARDKFEALKSKLKNLLADA